MDLLFDIRPDDKTEEFVKTCDALSVNDDTLFFNDYVHQVNVYK